MAYFNNYYPQYPYQSYAMPQQSYAQSPKTMEWVEGEVGAKAFQMPQGLPVNTPIPLWDSQEKKIYLKSWNQMGAANYPMQVLEYTIKEQPNPMLLAENKSGDAAPNYVTKEDFDKFKDELKSMMSHMNNNNNNRGGNNAKSTL